ncbi:MAG: hypothetical protein AVDCRST_MAG35-1846, partial [uncultured Quadrisphaera sp.]
APHPPHRAHRPAAAAPGSRRRLGRHHRAGARGDRLRPRGPPGAGPGVDADVRDAHRLRRRAADRAHAVGELRHRGPVPGGGARHLLRGRDPVGRRGGRAAGAHRHDHRAGRRRVHGARARHPDLRAAAGHRRRHQRPGARRRQGARDQRVQRRGRRRGGGAGRPDPGGVGALLRAQRLHRGARRAAARAGERRQHHRHRGARRRPQQRLHPARARRRRRRPRAALGAGRDRRRPGAPRWRGRRRGLGRGRL